MLARHQDGVSMNRKVKSEDWLYDEKEALAAFGCHRVWFAANSTNQPDKFAWGIIVQCQSPGGQGLTSESDFLGLVTDGNKPCATVRTPDLVVAMHRRVPLVPRQLLRQPG